MRDMSVAVVSLPYWRYLGPRGTTESFKEPGRLTLLRTLPGFTPPFLVTPRRLPISAMSGRLIDATVRSRRQARQVIVGRWREHTCNGRICHKISHFGVVGVVDRVSPTER
ncbi:uncharacterized protein PgNI_05002 [Pyricularia grisea]|uniref:Uncharacterized protein n=1 Tax=Pyricularia grisea TaxID=148305 RepID=A0A6P8BEG2_PYRGI|nr:uncharacterized protein PgNI_05002 [Pyricularia grisea]TLD14271.1 hypothetical protein PgNI_05002 [Pyricularia grisea]